MRITPRPWVAALEPYVPGRPAPSDAGSLASNEPGLVASAVVATAVGEALRRVHRYPDPLATVLRERLAGLHDVEPDRILVGNGSDELILLLVMAYAAAGGSVVVADPSYRLHETTARSLGAGVRRVPLAGWAHDVAAMTAVPADLCLVANPHNPAGTAVPARAIEAALPAARAGFVVVDEAYVEFADDPAETSAVRLAAEGRLVVLRTFSKAYGLAGMRVGYLVGPPEVVTDLRRIRAPFSVNALAQVAATAALADRVHLDRTVAWVRAGRRRLGELFERAGYRTIPSQANFVLVLAEDEAGLIERLLAGGVSVRPGSALGVPGAVRVTVPGEEGFALLERALMGPGGRAAGAE